MENLVMSLIVFGVCFVARLLLYIVTKNKKFKKNFGLAMEEQYLINRFKLDKNKLNKLSIASIISLMDAFIISLTLFIAVTITSNVMLEMLIGLVIVVCSILLFNEIFGRILLKRGYGRK